MKSKTKITTNLETGLTTAQVQKLMSEGEGNSTPGSETKSIRKILFENIFTFFNLINFILGAAILYTGSYRNLLFLIVVITNIVIGSWQEIKAKKILDKLSLLNAKKVLVLRNGKEEEISEKELVKGDIILLSIGNQVPADAILATGFLQVDQSLLTGESTPVLKEVGDQLLSGSIVLGGAGKAFVNEVGKNSFTGKLAIEAKKLRNRKSEIQDSIDSLIKVIAIALVPIGIILFIKDFYFLHTTLDGTIDSTAAALIAMIPQGLVLLISLVFAAAVIKLSKDHTLVQQMSSVPTLARVNTLCLDKTGTITEPGMTLRQFYPFKGFTKDEINQIVRNIYSSLNDHSQMIQTYEKLIKDYKVENGLKIVKVFPFSSLHKYSGTEYEVNGKTTSVLIGSAPVILGDKIKEIQKTLDDFAKAGDYVELMAVSNNPFPKDGSVPKDVRPACLIVYRNELRPSVPDALKFFIDQGIPIKIVSGDNPLTASAAAKRAGIIGYEKTANALDLKTYEDVREAVKTKVVFGNCFPKQKEQVVQALVDEGYVVGYFGNGVNDILALKEANISGAVADGAQAACVVSDIVLLNSSFAPLPKIVKEGRKLINNLQRSAVLYLTKTIFAILIVFVYMFLNRSYPFEPIQFSLVSAVTIGIPSFILAFEPNTDLVHGHFLPNVLYRAIPSGLVMFIGVGLVGIVGTILGLDNSIVSTLSVYALAVAGFLLLFVLSRPFNLFRALLLIAMLAIFIIVALFFGHFFLLESLNFTDLLYLGGIVIVEVVLTVILNQKNIANTLRNVGMKGYDKLNSVVSKIHF